MYILPDENNIREYFEPYYNLIHVLFVNAGKIAVKSNVSISDILAVSASNNQTTELQLAQALKDTICLCMFLAINLSI